MAIKVIKAKNIEKNQTVNVGGALLKVKSVLHNKRKKVVGISFHDTPMKQVYDYEEYVDILV